MFGLNWFCFVRNVYGLSSRPMQSFCLSNSILTVLLGTCLINEINLFALLYSFLGNLMERVTWFVNHEALQWVMDDIIVLVSSWTCSTTAKKHKVQHKSISASLTVIMGATSFYDFLKFYTQFLLFYTEKCSILLAKL